MHARTTDGVDIAWGSVGRGHALIHLPGVPFSNFTAEWHSPVLRSAYERLAEGVRLIQFDGRGTGRSQRDVTDLSLEAMQRDLDAVVDAAGLAGERIALLGFYHSVTSAIAYAARHPERVSHLILFGGASRGWSPMSGAEIQALLSLIERDWNVFVDSIAHAWLGWDVSGEEGRLAADWFRTATSPTVARATMQAAAGVDVTALLPDVQCPVLVLHRLGARVISLEMSEALVSGLPNARLEVLPGDSASLFYESTAQIVDLLIDFVGGRPVVGDVPAGRPGAASAAAGSAVSESPDGRAQLLSPRELEVLRLIAAGESNGEIAHRLGVTVNTVERHAVNLYRKIDARGRADAATFAVRNGLA
jgi:pimeloyl-ACP methyl ester carboxylesterase/DNA-binding CsgD family transcriptional regulator